MQDVGPMLNLNVAWQLLSLEVHATVSYLLPMTNMPSWTTDNSHWPKQILPVVRKKAEKHTLFKTYQYISKHHKDMHSLVKLCSWLIFSGKVNESEKYW